MSDKVACVEIARPDTHGGQSCIYRLVHAGRYPSVFSASDELDGAAEGESIVLTLRMMTEAELAELPEFEGW